MTGDLYLLRHFGKVLNVRPLGRDSSTVQDLLIEGLLKVRTKARGLILLKPNRAQQEYGRNCTRRNIGCVPPALWSCPAA